MRTLGVILFLILCVATATEINLFSCLDKLPAKTSCGDEIIEITKRQFEKEGFHRDLETQLNIDENVMRECTNIILLETFSESLYIDHYQIDELKRLKSFSWNYFIREPFDLEAPSFLAKPNKVTFIMESLR
jgi:hypothetical protein